MFSGFLDIFGSQQDTIDIDLAAVVGFKAIQDARSCSFSCTRRANYGCNRTFFDGKTNIIKTQLSII